MKINLVTQSAHITIDVESEEITIDKTAQISTQPQHYVNSTPLQEKQSKIFQKSDAFFETHEGVINQPDNVDFYVDALKEGLKNKTGKIKYRVITDDDRREQFEKFNAVFAQYKEIESSAIHYATKKIMKKYGHVPMSFKLTHLNGVDIESFKNGDVEFNHTTFKSYGGIIISRILGTELTLGFYDGKASDEPDIEVFPDVKVTASHMQDFKNMLTKHIKSTVFSDEEAKELDDILHAFFIKYMSKQAVSPFDSEVLLPTAVKQRNRKESDSTLAKHILNEVKKADESTAEKILNEVRELDNPPIENEELEDSPPPST